MQEIYQPHSICLALVTKLERFMLFELDPWSANKTWNIILRAVVTLEGNVLLGFHIIYQKIKQKVVGIELKPPKGAMEHHLDASQRCSKLPTLNQEPTMPSCTRAQALPQLFMESLSPDQSIHLQDRQWAHLFA